MAHINELGQEVLDNTPLSIPVPFTRPEPIHQRIRRMILLAQREAGEGYETEEEANDFDVPDDPNPDPTSPWEENFLPADLRPAAGVAGSDGVNDEKVSVHSDKNETPSASPASEENDSKESNS